MQQRLLQWHGFHSIPWVNSRLYIAKGTLMSQLGILVWDLNWSKEISSVEYTKRTY